MWNRSKKHGEGYRVASSHLITTCATFAAIILFTLIGSQVVPDALGLAGHGSRGSLTIALLLNIAIILFGWRRTKELASALTALDQAEQEAYRNAYVDCVTGLANRRALVKQLEEALAPQSVEATLILFDLDHFKKVNDLHGHAIGDALLAEVGSALGRLTPKSSLVSRLGGDEFAVLIPFSDPEKISAIAQQVIDQLSAPMQVGNVQAHVTASAGIATLVAGLSPEDMLRRADIAMYAAKRAGRNNASWFDAGQEAELKARVVLE